jgi:hypothetical protein
MLKTICSNTVRFGTLRMGYGLTQVSLEEVDGDRGANMILNFNIQLKGLKCGDALASLIYNRSLTGILGRRGFPGDGGESSGFLWHRRLGNRNSLISGATRAMDVPLVADH